MNKLKKSPFFALLILFLLVCPSIFSLDSSSPLEVRDQEDRPHRLSALLQDGNAPTLLLIYRAREAAEAGERHLALVQDRRRDWNRGADSRIINLIRMADLSRVPRLFRGLAARQLRKEFSGEPYYIDTTGSVADHFGLENEQYGLFLFQGEKEISSSILPFTDLEAMDKEIVQFLQASPLQLDR